MEKLKQRTIFGYAVGDLGINLNFQIIGFFLPFFYTDVFKIPAFHMGWMLLIARIWDAVNDPIMGFIADHTKTRWGKFRPYLLFAAIPLNLVLLACFYTPEVSEGWRVVYAYVTYMTQGMLFTVIGLPYSSLSAMLTQDQQERAVIGTYRMFFACVVAQGVTTLGIPWMVEYFQGDTVGWDQQKAYFISVCILAGCSVALLWTSFFSTKERVQVKAERYRLKDMFRVVSKNDALLSLSAAMFLNTGVWVTGNAVALYYFKYISGDESLNRVFFFWVVAANLAGALLAPKLCKLFGKRQMFIAGSAGVATMGIIRFFCPADAIFAFMVMSFFFAISQMFCSCTQWGMLPDTVEYGHWKTGQRSEGIPFAIFSFTQKAGMAIAAWVAAQVLVFTGYEADTVLNDSALLGIRSLFNLAPAAYSILCIVALMFYRINTKFYEQIIVELDERIAAESAESA